MGRSSRINCAQGLSRGGSAANQCDGIGIGGGLRGLGVMRVMGFKCGMQRTSNNSEITEAGGKLRLYVTADLGAGVAVPAGEGQAHYLLHVMRAKAGSASALFNGRDGEWLAEIAGRPSAA